MNGKITYLKVHNITVNVMGSVDLPPFHLAFPVHDLALARDFYMKYDLGLKLLSLQT